ncbi:metal ABC transporter solute-binding protein, Zn/Mn family [Adhaeretor mobilis]|nr:zinc ABC transporter substrate-binding protein [Adhaeretor mobilis]
MYSNSLSWIVTLTLLLTASAGCGGAKDATDTKSDAHDHSSPAVAHTYQGEYPIKALSTIGQVAEMVRRVGGEHVEVTQLMGPGIDPHLFKPVAEDTRALRNAEAIFYSGLHLEGRMTDLFEQMARRKLTYAVTSGLSTRKDPRLRKPPEFEGVYDPHVWHDVSLWSQCVEDIAEELAIYDPSHAEEYKKNAKTYRNELSELDAWVKSEVEKLPTDQRVLVTAHDAFEYFGAAYGFEVFGLKGISSELEKDLHHQEVIQAMIIKRNVPAVFVESAIAPRTVRALVEPCRAAGHDLQVPDATLYADVLGKPSTDAETYAGMIRHNVTTIITALFREPALSEK